MPLQSWSCDVCGEPVTASPADGLVVWKTSKINDDYRSHDFKIVHKTIDPGPNPRRCDPGIEAGYTQSLELVTFLGENGLAWLLSFLSNGPLKDGDGFEVANPDEFVDFVRRLQTPYYEEARVHFKDEKTQYWLDDANEVYPYLPETLKRIAEGTLGA